MRADDDDDDEYAIVFFFFLCIAITAHEAQVPLPAARACTAPRRDEPTATMRLVMSRRVRERAGSAVVRGDELQAEQAC